MLLPHVAKQDCFALKGGTAINLFLRDMPRLSVDIDLAYIPVEDRDTSLAGIDDALFKITNDIEQAVPRTSVRSSTLKGTDKRIKLVVSQGSNTVKVEVTPVLRGGVFFRQSSANCPQGLRQNLVLQEFPCSVPRICMPGKYVPRWIANTLATSMISTCY